MMAPMLRVLLKSRFAVVFCAAAALPLGAHAQVSMVQGGVGNSRWQLSGQPSPAIGPPSFSTTAPDTPELDRLRMEMQTQRLAERFRQIQKNTEKMVALSRQLAAVDKTVPAQVAQVDHLAAQIEKLSRVVRELEAME